MRHLVLFIVVPLLAGVGGCTKEEELTEICEYLKDPKDCNTTGNGETGDDPEPDELPPCTLLGDGHERTVYQCNGEFSASLSFTTILGDCGKTLGDPSWCTEIHAFGALDEPYEMPAVMACCDPDAPGQDDLLTYCSLDLVEQLCRSVTTRLQNLIDDGAFPVGKNQAQELQNWLAKYQQDCYLAFHQLTDVPGVLAKTSWLVNAGKMENGRH